MFYKQFSKIIDVLNPTFVDNFDFWLATLPRNHQKNITASVVSSRLGVAFSMAETILAFACNEGILQKYYLAKCPECDSVLETIEVGELAAVLCNPVYCVDCEDEKSITTDNIYTAYRIIKKSDASELEIAQAIEKRINSGSSGTGNFIKADSLTNRPFDLYKEFYNPSESAYEQFKLLRNKLDMDYGNDTTAKGKALENLILEIFNNIYYVTGSNDVKTETNQFDCTLLCRINTINPTVFSYLSPYFIVECKNEKEKPDNTYTNKLESILDTNAAQFGIVWGRKDATKPCFVISREHYLSKMNSPKQQIIITCSDDDLKYIIDKRVNLLEYLDFKIFQITSNSPKSTFEMFTSQRN